eukprot:gene3076-3541_t
MPEEDVGKEGSAQAQENGGTSSPDKQQQAAGGFDADKIKNIVIHHAKIVLAAMAIWTVGWAGLHYVWVLMGMLIFAIWRLNQKEKEKRMRSLREVTTNERKVLSQVKNLPSWVFFPDVQRAEWLNEIILQMWPYVGKMVHKIMKETVEPKMQEKLPGIIKSLYFEEVSLGNQAPQLGGIKVYTKNVERSEIIADVDFIYTGDASVKVNLKGMSAGITDIQVRGKIRVEINPLITSPPLIGGMSIYFLECPDIDFDLTNLLSILDMPGLSDILHCVIKDVLSSFVALPNRIKIPIAKNADLESLMYPMPDGVLKIEVIEAEDLMARDINVFSKNTSDPYVVLHVGQRSFKTKEMTETLSPVWNEAYELFIDNSQGRKIKVEVFDKDRGTSDESLGRTEISISKIVQKGITDLWLPLEGVKKGKIHLRCQWFKFSSKASDLAKTDKEDQSPTAALFVKLDSASNLPVTNKDDDTSNPFCTITVGNQIEMSKKLEDTSKPVWEEMFQFMVRDPKFQELNVQALDKKDDFNLGRLDFPIDRLLKQRNMRFKQPFNLKGATDESSLSMIVELKALVCDTGKNNADTKDDTEASTVRRRNKFLKGEIELTLKWNEGKNKVFIIVHKARDLMPENASDALNTFVVLTLLPDESESGMRQTQLVKEKDPKFEQEFDYFIGYEELLKRTLKVGVMNKQEPEDKSIGEVLIALNNINLTEGEKKW